MALTGLRDRTLHSYADGRTWRSGPYEWLTAMADFAVAPEHPANAGITDLAAAPRNGDGAVGFDADLRLLRPACGAGSGKLLLVVPNRGLLGGVPFSTDVPLLSPAGQEPAPGDGLLLDAGWTIAWCGWQWDVLDRPGAVGLTAPQAPLDQPGQVRVEFRPDLDTPSRPLSDSSFIFTFADYPTADLEDPGAVLYRRTAPDAEPEALPRDSWRFTDETTVALDGGFRAFHWYTLVYRTWSNPVTGTGLLAVRDAAAALRAEYGFTQVYAYGVSQSGRFLRQFLAEGRNLDEAGRQVFDGVFAHIAGGRTGEFNHRHAQPSLTHVIGFGNRPPYDTAGLLAAQRAAGGVPKLMLTNTSWEYWRGDGALVHVDPVTGADLPEDPDTRVYLLRGTDHLGSIPIKDAMPGANPVHALDTQPLLRAILFALDAWVTDGASPPPSDVPRSFDGTAASRPDVITRFAGASGVHVPDPAHLNVTREVDLGADVARGIGRWPLQLGEARAAVVADVDAGGNERAGVALPAVAVPVAAYTGWNPRRPVAGLPDVLYEFLGSRLPLLQGRPAPRADYEQAVRAAAYDLVDRRHLLPPDVERTVTEALRLYDDASPR